MTGTLKGLVSIGQTLVVLGTSLTSLTKAEINKIGLTPDKERHTFLAYARQGRTRQKRRNGFGSTMIPEPASQSQLHTARSPVDWLRTVHWHAIYIIAGP